MQKKRSKDSSKQVDLTAADAVRQQLQSVGVTRFQGYEDVQGAGAVVAILKDGNMVSTAQEGQHHGNVCSGRLHHRVYVVALHEHVVYITDRPSYCCCTARPASCYAI